MKILHILSSPRAEGTPNLVLDWLATDLHQQEVFVLNCRPADLTDKLRAAAHWYGEEDYFSWGWRKFGGIAAGVRRVCHERRPDLLVCWPTGFANWICMGARSAGVSGLLVHAGNPPNRGVKGDWISRYGFWPLAIFGAQCICCSYYVRDRYRSIPGIPDDLFHTVWNCARVDDVSQRATSARQQHPPSERPPTAIMVATLERHKDHVTLLRAVGYLRRQIPTFRLRLVGDGSMRAELERLTAEFGIADAVEFLGVRRDVPELLGQADVFVFSTTLQEGLGTVLVEALAAALPVVASDVPACRELLADGRFGRLIPPGDADALALAIADSLRRASPLQAATRLEYLDKFSTVRMMAGYLGHVNGRGTARSTNP